MAATKADLVNNLTGYGYTLKADSSPRGFDKQLYVLNSGVACTVTSTGAAHTIVASSTNRLDPTNSTVSIGSLDAVIAHLKQVYGK